MLRVNLSTMKTAMKSEASKDPAKDVATKEHEARHYLYERKYPIGHRGTSSNWLNPTYTVGGRPKVSKVSFFPTENEPKAYWMCILSTAVQTQEYH